MSQPVIIKRKKIERDLVMGWIIFTPTQALKNEYDSESGQMIDSNPSSIFPISFPNNKKQKVQIIFPKFPLF